MCIIVFVVEYLLNTVSHKEGGKFSKIGHCQVYSWCICTSSIFHWNSGSGCGFSDGLNKCFIEGTATTIVRFDEVTRVKTDNVEVNNWEIDTGDK